MAEIHRVWPTTRIAFLMSSRQKRQTAQKSELKRRKSLVSNLTCQRGQQLPKTQQQRRYQQETRPRRLQSLGSGRLSKGISVPHSLDCCLILQSLTDRRAQQTHFVRMVASHKRSRIGSGRSGTTQSRPERPPCLRWQRPLRLLLPVLGLSCALSPRWSDRGTRGIG